MTHSQTSAGPSARTTDNTAEISLEVNGISRRLAPATARSAPAGWPWGE